MSASRNITLRPTDGTKTSQQFTLLTEPKCLLDEAGLIREKLKPMTRETNDGFSEKRLEELENEVYESEDPTKFPDDVLAAIWRKEWKRQDRMKHGEKELKWRCQQNSLAVNVLCTFEKDCRSIAKTKLNTQRTALLRLADKFAEINADLRTSFQRYCRYGGWKK